MTKIYLFEAKIRGIGEKKKIDWQFFEIQFIEKLIFSIRLDNKSLSRVHTWPDIDESFVSINGVLRKVRFYLLEISVVNAWIYSRCI